MIEINLLPKQNLLSLREQKLRFQMTMVALGIGTLLLVCWVVVFFLDRFGSSQFSSLSARKKELEVQLDSQIPKLEMLYALKDKTEGIRIVRATRPDLSSAITKLKGFSVNGMVMKKLFINSDSALSFSVDLADKNVLVRYFDKLGSEEAKNFFQPLTISGLDIGADGVISFSVEGGFKK